MRQKQTEYHKTEFEAHGDKTADHIIHLQHFPKAIKVRRGKRFFKPPVDREQKFQIEAFS
jgi:hypothetical protein